MSERIGREKRRPRSCQEHNFDVETLESTITIPREYLNILHNLWEYIHFDVLVDGRFISDNMEVIASDVQGFDFKNWTSQ